MKSWLRGLLGRKGEQRAAAFLKQKGLRIVGRGVANRCGEIDLIALDGETIVFVEVRTRQSLDAGHPAESVTIEKQAKVTRAALSYLKSKNLWNRRTRFDVVAIVWPDGAREPQIEHYQTRSRPSGRNRCTAERTQHSHTWAKSLTGASARGRSHETRIGRLPGVRERARCLSC